MAGWSKVADESSLDSEKNKTPQKPLEPNGFWFDLEPPSKESGPVVETEPDNQLRSWFDQFLEFFLKKIHAPNCFWPLPPMLADGLSVDLFKLFLVVRQNGGYDAVSGNGLWDFVAEESGLGQNLASAVKLVYVKYLDALNRWLDKVVEEKEYKSKLSDSGLNLGEFLMGLDAFLSEIPNLKMKSDEEYPHLEMSFSDERSSGKSNAGAMVKFECGNKCVGDEERMLIESKKSVGDFMEVGNCSNGDVGKRLVVDLTADKECADVEEISCSDFAKSVASRSDVGKVCSNDEVKSVVVEFNGGKKSSDTDEDVKILAAGFKKEMSRKRKRESVWGMLNWVTEIAKDPCDPVVGFLPDKSRWNSYGNEELWKQVLLYREAVFQKTNADSSAEQSILQKNQKMHPCMYDDHVGSSYNLRERLTCSKKLLFGNTTSQAQGYSSSGTQSDLDKNLSPYMAAMGSFFDSSIVDSAKNEEGVPLGSKYQAKVPEWTGVVTESDSKWLGTRVWPLEKVEHRSLIERERIGKGRQDSCGCHVRGSVDCVRFHIAEKRFRVKLELGSAFNRWKLNTMGEEAKLSWTEEEEKKFKDMKNLNPIFQEKSFWDQIVDVLPTKRREDLVSYYFNVFLLERRACQNRLTSSKIGSDDEVSDEESEAPLVTNGPRHKAIKSPRSLLHSQNKSCKKV